MWQLIQSGEVVSQQAAIEDAANANGPGVFLDAIDFLGQSALMFLFGMFQVSLIMYTILTASIGVLTALALSSGYLLT